MGLDAGEDEVFSAVSAAVHYLRQYGRPSCHLLVADNVKPCFDEFPADAGQPDFVVIGDIGSAWNYELMDHAFKLLLGGARLLSLHRNKYWQTETGLKLDIGAFVCGLEYASGVQAAIVGKPSRTYFQMALASLQMSPVQVAIVGDDVETDIGGGQSAGLQGVLVQTGKYRAELALHSGIRSDRVIPSIADLPELLTRIHVGT
jgi:HAD superfamily hydrolase (TIGR01458 family)